MQKSDTGRDYNPTIWDLVEGRVGWWLEDMAFKAPEQLTPHYFMCMRRDIADHAVGKDDLFWSSRRLDS